MSEPGRRHENGEFAVGTAAVPGAAVLTVTSNRPLAVAELILLFITLRHILTHKTYKRGSRTLWLIVAIVGMEFIGPILYFLLGKED